MRRRIVLTAIAVFTGVLLLVMINQSSSQPSHQWRDAYGYWCSYKAAYPTGYCPQDHGIAWVSPVPVSAVPGGPTQCLYNQINVDTGNCK
jgi:hypothetical protein